MSNRRGDDVAALQREGGRAIRHFFVFWFGIPLLLVLGLQLLVGVLGRFGEGQPIEAVLLLAIGGAAFLIFGRLLWRKIKS